MFTFCSWYRCQFNIFNIRSYFSIVLFEQSYFSPYFCYRRLFPHAQTPMKTNQQPKGNKKISCRPPVSVLLIKLVCFYLWYNELFLFSMSCAYTAYKKNSVTSKRQDFVRGKIYRVPNYFPYFIFTGLCGTSCNLIWFVSTPVALCGGQRSNHIKHLSRFPFFCFLYYVHAVYRRENYNYRD